MSISSAFQRDANHVPITSMGLIEAKTVVFSPLTTGAVGELSLFAVTGTVVIRVLAVCTDSVAGSGTLEVGAEGSINALLGQISAADLDVGETWTLTDQATIAALGGYFVTAADAIIQTIGTDTVDEGSVTYYALWAPISSDGNVVAA